MPVQSGLWLSRVLRGDLGTSAQSNFPVSRLIIERAPATMELTFPGFILSALIGLALGIKAVVKQHSAIDWAIPTFMGFAIATPKFWLGILCIMLFALVLGWLPAGGHGDFTRDPVQALKLLLLPAACLALHPGVGLSSLVKASMLEVLYEDYIRTVRAKGVANGSVILGHMLRLAPSQSLRRLVPSSVGYWAEL